jgi:hypothetical protein
MQKKCLFVNPVSNGKNLAAYFKDKGVEIFVLIEVQKVRNTKGRQISESETTKFDHTFYSDYFVNIEQVLTSGIVFDCIIPGSECGVDTCELLADKLGLMGNNPVTTLYRRDKFVMQEQLQKNNLTYAKSLLIDLNSEKQLTQAQLNGFSFPLVLKPVNGAGMEDVYICDNLNELNDQLKNIEYGKFNCTWVPNTHFVIQEYLEGDEFALDYIVHEGIPYICVVSKYVKNFKVDNKYITTESVFYNPVDPEYESLITYGKNVIKALDVTNGAVHAEFITDGTKHCLIDIGARMRGGGDPWFYNEIYSIGLLEAIYDKYINEGQNLKDSILIKQASHVALSSSEDGVFTGLTPQQEQKLDKLPLLRELTLNIDKDQPYNKTTNLLTSIGEATIIGDDLEQVRNTVYDLYQILEPHFGDWYKQTQYHTELQKTVIEENII